MTHRTWAAVAPIIAASDPEERAFAAIRETILRIETQRDRYETALRKIAEWKSYVPYGDTFSEYEQGANDMLATLKKMAEEALS